MTIAHFDHVSAQQYAADVSGYSVAMAIGDIPLPHRATTGSAGYDFISPVDTTIAPGETHTIPTGIRAHIDAGWVLLICPRSSLGRKWSIRLANTVGVIDSDYVNADNEGHILVMLTNGGTVPFVLHRGDRFCQGIFLPFGTAEEEPVTSERHGGYGSTGV